MTSLSGTVSTPFQPPGSRKKPFPVAEIEQETEGEIEVQKNEWRVHCQETRDGGRERENKLLKRFNETPGWNSFVPTSVVCFRQLLLCSFIRVSFVMNVCSFIFCHSVMWKASARNK